MQGKGKGKGKGKPAMDIALMPIVCMACRRTHWTHHQIHPQFMFSLPSRAFVGLLLA